MIQVKKCSSFSSSKGHTVRMKYLTIFSGQLHLLHQFKSDFAHLLVFKNLIIELLNAKNEQKIIKDEILDTTIENLHTFTNWSSLLLVQGY